MYMSQRMMSFSSEPTRNSIRRRCRKLQHHSQPLGRAFNFQMAGDVAALKFCGFPAALTKAFQSSWGRKALMTSLVRPDATEAPRFNLEPFWTVGSSRTIQQPELFQLPSAQGDGAREVGVLLRQSNGTPCWFLPGGPLKRRLKDRRPPYKITKRTGLHPPASLTGAWADIFLGFGFGSVSHTTRHGSLRFSGSNCKSWCSGPNQQCLVLVVRSLQRVSEHMVAMCF